MRLSPRSFAVVPLLLFCYVLTVAAPAAAQSVVYVDADATGANDGTSWADAYTDLAAALADATGSDEIWIAEGVYTPSSADASFTITGAQDGLALYGGFAGTESDRSERDVGDHPTILSGDVGGDDLANARGITRRPVDIVGSNSGPVLLLDEDYDSPPITPATVIDGVTVTAGQAEGYPGGGALSCTPHSDTGCSPTLRNVVFVGNTAQENGGAICVVPEGFIVSIRITNAVFVNNSAGLNGGAIDIGEYQNPYENENPQITNAVFVNNTADNDGGAIAYDADGELAITNTILWGNRADADGDGNGYGDQVLAVGGSDATFVHSIVEGSGGSSGWDADLGTDGGHNLDVDPRFNDTVAPAGPDGVFATKDDGVNVLLASPAVDAGTNDSVAVSLDLLGRSRIQDIDGDSTATVNIGAYEYPADADVSVAITGGGLFGLDRAFAATPGRSDQPIGILRLTPEESGARLMGLTVTPDAAGATGVERLALWLSDDAAFDASADAELAGLATDPEATLPATLSFEGFDAPLPAHQARYLFVTADLTDDAEGAATGYLANEAALSLDRGVIEEVNGTEQHSFLGLPLSRGAAALPVELTAFEARTTGAGGVRLTWQTASETGNAGFAVERSTGGGAFNEVAFVASRAPSGTSAQPQRYRFVDDALPPAADTLHYRLRQVDTDGAARLTEAIVVARGAAGRLALTGPYPNPARSEAVVRIAVPDGAAADEVRLGLYDVLGRRVATVQADAAPGRHTLRLDVAGLVSGVYLLRLTAGGAVETRRLTVVR